MVSLVLKLTNLIIFNFMKRDFNKMGRISTKSVDYSQSHMNLEVIPNQSVTPAQMLNLAAQGIPISAENSSVVSGEPNPSWDVPLDKVKRIDPAELWQHQQNVRKQVREAHKRFKNKQKHN